MKITNNINSPKFGMRMTKEVKRGFEILGREIEEFYGENGRRYYEYMKNMNIINQRFPHSVLKVNRSRNYSPYSFSISHRNGEEISVVSDIEAKTKQELFTEKNLKSLASTTSLDFAGEKVMMPSMPKETVFDKILKLFNI